jgi:lysyl-tRNA synthetase class 2
VRAPRPRACCARLRDAQKFFENRVKGINAAKAAGENPFPHKWHVTSSLPAFVEKFASLEVGASEEATIVSVAGAQPPASATASRV